MIAFASSLDQCGPLSRDVSDAALLLAILQGADPCDSTSVGLPGGLRLPDREDLSGLRFGVPSELAQARMDAGVRGLFEATLATIEDLGGEIATDLALPNAEHGISAYYVLAPAEASSNLARYDGVRYGRRSGRAGDLLEMYETTRAEGFGSEVKRRIMLGTYALSSGYYEAYYGQAQKVRTRIAEDFASAFEAVDFVVTPTSPSVAFELGEKTGDPLAMYLNDFFTVPMSLAGIPAISIPAGLAEPEGGGPQLPVGFQIAAPAFAEQKLLDAAYALERAIGFNDACRSRLPWSERSGDG
jgi:aspartyl-tRNA(Asn)/glutamyl-tRNA(Gln) amidotransferase subunit A